MGSRVRILVSLLILLAMVSSPVLSSASKAVSAGVSSGVRELADRPVIVEVYRYNRIIDPGSLAPLFQSKAEELSYWIREVYRPVSETASPPNGSAMSIPKGEAYIFVASPTLLLEALAGVERASQLIGLDDLLDYETWSTSEYVPYEENGFIWYRSVKREFHSPPNVLEAYYAKYYEETRSSPDVKAGGFPWNIGDNYRRLLSDILRIARENTDLNQGDVTSRMKLLVEWEIDNPEVGVLYPVKMDYVIPREVLPGGLQEKYVYSPSYVKWSYNTEFPVPIPLYPTPHYESLIDLNNPLDTLENNIVIVGINPSAYSGSFNLYLRVRTLDGRPVMTLKYTFEVNGEYWRFLETNQPVIWSYAPLQLRDQVSRLAMSLGLDVPRYYSDPQSASKYTDNAYHWGIAEFPSYDVNWTSDPLSVTLSSESRSIEYVHIPDEVNLHEGRYTHNMYLIGSVRIAGYGDYGEAILEVTYYYESNLNRDYKINGVPKDEEESSSGITVKATVIGGGALPVPSPVIVAYKTNDGDTVRTRPLGYKKRLGGTGFIGYAEYVAETSSYKYIADWGRTGCTDTCNPEIHLTAIPYTENSNLRSEIKGFAVYRINDLPLYLFPLPSHSPSRFDYAFQEIVDYNGTGKPNYIRVSTLDLKPSLDSVDSHWEGFGDHNRPRIEGLDFEYEHIRGIKCYYDEDENRTVCKPLIDTCWVSCSYLVSDYTFTTHPPALGSGPPHVPEKTGFMLPYFLAFIPSQNIEVNITTPNISYLNVNPTLAEALPGGKVRYVAEAVKNGEPLSGRTLEISIMHNTRVIKSLKITLDEEGAAAFDLEAPTLDELEEIVGGRDKLNEMICNWTKPPVIEFLVNFTVPEEGLSSYTVLEVKIGTGITGTVAAVDFDTGNKVGSKLWLGFRVTDTEYHPFLLDPNLDEVPLEMLPFTANYVESVEENLGRELNLVSETRLVVVNASDPSQVLEFKVNGTSYAIALQPGDYKVHLEVEVKNWKGTPQVFKTREVNVSIGEDPVSLDYYVPIAPIFRTLKLLDEVEEWSITNLDLAYLVEGFEKVSSLPAEKLSVVVHLLSRTLDLLANVEGPICKFNFDLMTGFVYHLAEIPPPQPCSYLQQVTRVISGLLDYLASGGKDPAVFRKYALEAAKVNVSLVIADIVRKDVEGLFLKGALPDYDTEKFLLNPADPWNRLYRDMLAIAYLDNLKAHITRQVRILAKLTALMSSLAVKDYLVMNKLFPFGDTLSKLLGKAGEALGGEKSAIVRTVSRVFPSLQVLLNSAKIGAFTTVGMGLNLGITNPKVKEWIVPAGYKGVDVGYSIANFFKFNRFILSVLINSAETDCVFEVVFQVVSQLAAWTLFTVARYPLDLVFLHYHKQVWSGKGDGTMFDAMKAAYVSEAAVLETAKILEVALSGITSLANFLRGFGGLIDYVTSVKSVAAFKKLLGKTADNDVFLEYVQAKRFGDAASLIRKKGLVGFLARIGKPMATAGVRTVTLALSLGVVGLIAADLASMHFAYNVLHSKKTSLAGMVSDIGSVLRLFGKYKTVEASNPLDKSTYKCEEGLIDTLRSIISASGGESLRQTSIPPIKSSGLSFSSGLGGGWDDAEYMNDLINDLIGDLENGVLDLDTYSEIGVTGERLWWKLEAKKAEVISSGARDQYIVLSLVDHYETLFDEFMREAYTAGTDPDFSVEGVKTLAEMLGAVLEKIQETTPPNPSRITVPYASLRARDLGPDQLVIDMKAWGVEGPLEIRLSSAELGVNPTKIVVYKPDATINVTLNPIHPNATTGIVDITVIHDGKVIGGSSILVGASNLHEPWIYNTNLGTLYSLKELDIKDTGGTVKLSDAGNNLLIIYGEKPVLVKTSKGHAYWKIVETGNSIVTIVRLVNTTTVELAPGEITTGNEGSQQTGQPHSSTTSTSTSKGNRGGMLKNTGKAALAVGIAVAITIAALLLNKYLITKTTKPITLSLLP